MAKITEIRLTDSNYNMREVVTNCIAEYNEYDQKGEKFVRLQTFGSNYRQDKGKQSQVLHIDKKIAEQLIKLMQHTFQL